MIPGTVRDMMTEEEVEVCLAMEDVLERLNALLAAQNDAGAAKDNEKARFYAVARTHQQTALAYFEYWLTQRAILASVIGGGPL